MDESDGSQTGCSMNHKAKSFPVGIVLWHALSSLSENPEWLACDVEKDPKKCCAQNSFWSGKVLAEVQSPWILELEERLTGTEAVLLMALLLRREKGPETSA